MIADLSSGIWLWICITLAGLVIQIKFIVSYQRDKGTRDVKVEHLREPLVAALNFISIVVALVAAATAYAASAEVGGTINLLVASILCFFLAGLLIVVFLLGIPNLAAKKEIISFSFLKDWDVIIVPSAVKLLIFFGLTWILVYFLFEFQTSPKEVAATANSGSLVTADTGCVNIDDGVGRLMRVSRHGGALLVQVQNDETPDNSCNLYVRFGSERP